MSEVVCPVARQLCDLRNDLIAKQGLPASTVARGFAYVGGHACGWEAAAGKSDEAQEAFDEGHAQGRADYSDSVSARIAELEAENAALRAQVKESSCWHCGDVLESEPPPRCERCPAFGECDDGACPEPGCADEVNRG